MVFEELLTSRMVLRKLNPEIYNYVYANFSNKELIDFLSLPSPHELQVEKQKYSNGLATYNKSFLLFNLLNRNSNQLLGWCGFHTWYIDHYRAEIGYGLYDESLKGKGLMTEAMESVIDYGFEKMKLNRIEAFIGPENLPSLKLATKFRFVKEGHLREHYNHLGKIEDSLVFSLLKGEYERSHKSAM